MRTLLLDVARHLVSRYDPGGPDRSPLDARSEAARAPLVRLVSESVATTLKAESETLSLLRKKRLHVEPEPNGAMVVRCDARPPGPAIFRSCRSVSWVEGVSRVESSRVGLRQGGPGALPSVR